MMGGYCESSYMFCRQIHRVVHPQSLRCTGTEISVMRPHERREVDLI